MTEAQQVWNRACLDAATSNLLGDVALAALIRFHGIVMNGGVLHAMEVLSPAEIAAAEAGFRFFDFAELPDLIQESLNVAADKNQFSAIGAASFPKMRDPRPLAVSASAAPSVTMPAAVSGFMVLSPGATLFNAFTPYVQPPTRTMHPTNTAAQPMPTRSTASERIVVLSSAPTSGLRCRRLRKSAASRGVIVNRRHLSSGPSSL